MNKIKNIFKKNNDKELNFIDNCVNLLRDSIRNLEKTKEY
jgi:hypothetical protein